MIRHDFAVTTAGTVPEGLIQEHLIFWRKGRLQLDDLFQTSYDLAGDDVQSFGQRSQLRSHRILQISGVVQLLVFFRKFISPNFIGVQLDFY